MTTSNDLLLQARRIPIIGDDIYQVGQVYNIVSQPCTPDAMIAVTAAFSYAPTLIWSLIKPDPLDFLYNRFRQPHKRVRKRRWRVARTTQLGLVETAGVKTAVFAIGNAIQRVGWYLIVADATTDWALNWTSLAYQWSGCSVPNPLWAWNGGDWPFWIEPFVGSAYLSDVPNSDKAGAAAAGGTQLILLSTGPYSASVSIQPKMRPYLGVPGNFDRAELWIRHGATLVAQQPLDKYVDPQQGETWTGMYRDYTTNEKQVRAELRVWWTGGQCKILNQSMQLSGGAVADDFNGLTFDP